MNNGDLESNGDPDTTGDGHLFVPGNVNADIGKSLDCLLLENDSKLGDQLLAVLDTVKIKSIILMVILTVLEP